MSGAALPRAERFTALLTCQCNEPHLDSATPPASHPSCGRKWLAQVTLNPDMPGPRIQPSQDPGIVDAAIDWSKFVDAQETTIKTQAEKWTGAVTALLGLFGVAAFVTGKDAFTGLDMWAKIVAAVAVVCALSIGVVAVFVSNRAAYGWPELMKVKTDEDLLKWHDDRPKRLQKAARRMKIAVWLAIVSLGFVTLAAVLMWLAPRHVDKTNASNAGQNIPVISLAASRLGERC